MVPAPVARTVRVTDEDGRPIADGEVTVDPVLKRGGVYAATAGGYSLRTDPNGECEVRAVEGHTYRLTASAQGFQPESDWDWNPPMRSDAATVFRLNFGLLVRGRVLSEGAAPVAGAEIELVGPDRHRCESSEDGDFEFDRIEPGTYRFTITDRDGVIRDLRTIDLKGNANLGRITLHPIESIEARVLSLASKPVSRAKILVQPGTQETRTDREGRFTLRMARPNGVCIVIEHEQAGRCWTPAGKIRPTIVMPRQGAVSIVLVGRERSPLDSVIVRFGPRGLPPLTRIVPARAEDVAKCSLGKLPAGELVVDTFGQTERVEVVPGQTHTVAIPMLR